MYAAVDHRTRERTDRIGARAHDADAFERRVGKHFGRRKQRVQANRCAVCKWRAVPLRDARGQRARGGDADLLAENRAYRQFESVPGIRQTLARPAAHQGFQ